MPDPLNLTNPWLIAVWPGMGHVALNAGIYLLSKLDMTAVAELDAGDLFDVDQVEVKGGLIQPGRPAAEPVLRVERPGQAARPRRVPRRGPAAGRQVRVLPAGHRVRPRTTGSSGCSRSPRWRPRCGRTTGPACSARPPTRRACEELKRLELTILEDGNIGGLNGVLLGAAAAEAGCAGRACSARCRTSSPSCRSRRRRWRSSRCSP